MPVVIERGAPGLSAPKIEGKLSLRASITGEIVLEDIDTTPYKERAGVGKGVAIDKLATAAE